MLILAINPSRNINFSKRRNKVRAFLLFVFSIMLLSFLFALYKKVLFKPIQIQIENSITTKEQNILRDVKQIVQNKNFFLISPKEISLALKISNPTLKDIVVRKYVFPSNKLLIFVASEKEVWGKLVCLEKDKLLNLIGYVTSDGKMIYKEQINEDKINDKLVLLELADCSYNKVYIDKNMLVDLKEILKLLTSKYKLEVNKVQVLPSMDLYVYLESGLKINLGKADNTVFSRVSMIEGIKSFINNLEYLDLTPQKIVIYKEKTDLDKKE